MFVWLGGMGPIRYAGIFDAGRWCTFCLRDFRTGLRGLGAVLRHRKLNIGTWAVIRFVAIEGGRFRVTVLIAYAVVHLARKAWVS